MKKIIVSLALFFQRNTWVRWFPLMVMAIVFILTILAGYQQYLTVRNSAFLLVSIYVLNTTLIFFESILCNIKLRVWTWVNDENLVDSNNIFAGMFSSFCSFISSILILGEHFGNPLLTGLVVGLLIMYALSWLGATGIGAAIGEEFEISKGIRRKFAEE